MQRPSAALSMLSRALLSLLPILQLAAAVVSTTTPPPSRFEVTSLPGWVDAADAPAELPSRMFTGYLDAGVPPSGVGTMYFHYWLVESERDPANDPVLIWYNGGPGASSLFGLLQEWGPLRLLETSYDQRYNKTGVPTPQFNPYRWTKTHTVVAIDSPPPMGLSFCSEAGPAGNATSCGPWTDKTVFAANHAAHRTFFTSVFPELAANPVYLTGESYAGIYLPGFADAMMSDPIKGVNFQGWAIGDGWTGCRHVAGKPANWCIDLYVLSLSRCSLLLSCFAVSVPSHNAHSFSFSSPTTYFVCKHIKIVTMSGCSVPKPIRT